MQQKIKEVIDQVLYNGIWVDRKYFRTFVYSIDDRKLAESYKEYEDLVSTGLWFNDPPVAEAPVKSKARKPKDGGDS